MTCDLLRGLPLFGCTHLVWVRLVPMSCHALPCSSMSTCNMSTVAGTVAWMAPEMIRGKGITEKCDVYSYGVIVWELLTQEVPFAGCHMHNVMWLVGAQGMRPPVPEGTPAPLQDLLVLCWDNDPKKRPAFSKVMERLQAMRVQDDQLAVQLAEFHERSAYWQQEINIELEKYKLMQEKQMDIVDKEADLARRELLVAEREKALYRHLDSLQLAKGMSSGPAESSYPSLSQSARATSAEKHPSKWSESEVHNWISTLPEKDIRKYAEIFTQNNINGQRLVKLTDAKLESGLKISSFGHRECLLEAIKGLENATAFPTLGSAVNRARGCPADPAGISNGGRSFSNPRSSFGITPNGVAMAGFEVTVYVWAKWLEDEQGWEIRVVPDVHSEQAVDTTTIIGSVTYTYWLGDNAGNTESNCSEASPHNCLITNEENKKTTIALTIVYSRSYKRKTSKVNFKLEAEIPREASTPVTSVTCRLQPKQGKMRK